MSDMSDASDRTDASGDPHGPERLGGRVVLVTGAARGIGFAIAREMAANGAILELADVDDAAVARAAEDLAGEAASRPGAVMGRHVDVASPEQVGDWITDIVRRRARIDVLVNNAGVQLNRAALDLTYEDWRRVLDVNLDGAFLCSREAARHMRSRGAGAIINVGSIAERFGMPRRVPYGVSKAGLSALTRGLAAEWAGDGLRVNAIAPGYVETDLVRHAFERGHIDREAILAKIPLGRLAEPRHIAHAAVFLASDAAAYITGHTLYVDGGYSIFK